MTRTSVLALLTIAACRPAAEPEPEASGAPGASSIAADKLDRGAPGGSCGYPGGPYGTDVGQRLANFTLTDCRGNNVDFAQYFCKRQDGYGDFNRAVLVSIGAGWCKPCREETKQLAAKYAALHGQGVEFVQVMFQDDQGELPTRSWCRDSWVGNDEFAGGVGFPVLLDQTNDWTKTYMDDKAAVPINMLLDANGNIRFKTVGKVPDDLEAQIGKLLTDPYGA